LKRGFVDLSKIKLTIAYDGTQYSGWQIQRFGIGVQQKIEEALGKLFPAHPRLHSSSRTDTGVHALGMVAHFEVPREQFRMTNSKLQLALNAWLPPEIRIFSVSQPKKEFHARFDATGKQYRYFVWNHSVMNPLLRHTAWHVPRALEIGAMRQAALSLLGKHDFRSFSANQGYERSSTIRTVTRCDLKKSGSLITFIIEADGFIYKMCRGIVGTLVQIGLGKLPENSIHQMLARKDRRSGGMTAPAHGLVLWKVYYGKKPSGKSEIQNSKSK